MLEWEFLFFFFLFLLLLKQNRISDLHAARISLLGTSKINWAGKRRTFCVLPCSLVTWKQRVVAICREGVNFRLKKDTANPLPQAEVQMVLRRRFKWENYFTQKNVCYFSIKPKFSICNLSSPASPSPTKN